MAFAQAAAFFIFIGTIIFFIIRKVARNLPKRMLFQWLGIMGISFIVVQFIGMLIWRLFVEHTLVREVDSWIPFLTFSPLTWERIFKGVSTTFHEPLGYFHTTGQVATFHSGIALLLIVISIFVPSAILSKRSKEHKKEILLVGMILFIAQIIWLGLANVVTPFMGQ